MLKENYNFLKVAFMSKGVAFLWYTKTTSDLFFQYCFIIFIVLYKLVISIRWALEMILFGMICIIHLVSEGNL